MAEINTTLKQLRLTQAGIVIFLLVCITLGELAPKRSVPPWSFSHSLMAALGLVCLLEAFNFRYRFLPAAAAKLAPRCHRRGSSSSLAGLAVDMFHHGCIQRFLRGRNADGSL